ncbi:YncE family protein [Legionella sp. 16cNR16C]|uniref:YncE family protein n=1 Tax=Legionella sp. 16cNR16C TaxID=2905656 RepID=UPI001E296DA8|nr:YncE family protein [Legionella sp. 16cNR16C]MCE3044295.1 YncE family protein [Legionella sp. 16cNR16C]
MSGHKVHLFIHALLGLLSLLFISSVQAAATPLWTFIPQTPVELTLTNSASAEVIYTVQNQSVRPKSLVMMPIAGVTQNGVCQLPGKGSCTLRLSIQGNALQGDVLGGPILCQQGDPNQCYQPALGYSLRIHFVNQPPVQQFTVTPSAGPNGSITPSTPQVVNSGSNLVFMATPIAGFAVKQWLLDGMVVQNGGTSFQLNNIDANHRIEVVFGQYFAYVTNDFDSGADNVTRCRLDVGGNFIDCTIVGSGFTNPLGLVFNREGTRIYVANFGIANTVRKCDIGTNGILQNCINSAAIFNNPVGVAINPQGTKIYVTNNLTGNISLCDLDTNGNLINCTITALINFPRGIIFNPAGTKVYVTNNTNVTRCDVGFNGDLVNCTLVGFGLIVPVGITFNASGTRLYTVSGPNFLTGEIDRFDVDANGDLSNPAVAGTSGTTSRFIALNADQTIAYVTNASNDNVTKCEIDINGNFTNCSVTGFNMDGATGLQLVVQ